MKRLDRATLTFPCENRDATVKVTAYYNEKGDIWKLTNNRHIGIDLTGFDMIYPVAKGIVSESGYKSVNGYQVSIKDYNGYTHTYAHLEYIEKNIKVGTFVGMFDCLGKMGSTGLVTGKHLHYDLRNKNNEYVDPVVYLKIPTNELGTYHLKYYHFPHWCQDIAENLYNKGTFSDLDMWTDYDTDLRDITKGHLLALIYKSIVNK